MQEVLGNTERMVFLFLFYFQEQSVSGKHVFLVRNFVLNIMRSIHARAMHVRGDGNTHE